MVTNETMQKIIRNFENQVTIYKELLACLDHEKEAAIAADVAAVDAVVSKKKRLIEKLGMLDKAQRKNIIEISVSYGFSPDDVTLLKLASYTENPQRKILTGIRDKLSELVQTVQEKSRANRSLLTHCIGLVKSTLGLMDRSYSETPVYYRSGEIKDGKRGGMLVSGVI